MNDGYANGGHANGGYRWLLFDADGTLFDYERAEVNALGGALARFDQPLDPPTLAVYRDINQSLWRDFEQGLISSAALRVLRFERFFSALELALDPQAFSPVYLRCLADQVDLIEGANEILDVLRRRYRLALITNGLKEVQRSRLARSPIGQYFQAVIISEEAGAAKPHPAIFARAFELMEHPPTAEVLMIGDSLSSDIRGAEACGIDACWFNPAGAPLSSGLQPKYHIQRLEQLGDFL